MFYILIELWLKNPTPQVERLLIGYMLKSCGLRRSEDDLFYKDLKVGEKPRIVTESCGPRLRFRVFKKDYHRWKNRHSERGRITTITRKIDRVAA